MDKFSDDLMIKVMNRPLGSGSNNCESSPQKRHFRTAEDGRKIVSDSNDRVDPTAPSSSLINSEIVAGFKGTDEVDGFTSHIVDRQNVEKVSNLNTGADITRNFYSGYEGIKGHDNNDIRSEFVRTSKTSDIYAEKKENAASMKFNVEVRESGENGSNESDATEQKTEYDNERYSYVMSDDEASEPSEPRVEMFNETDSNSSSNPFILSNFQSLNAGCDVEVTEQQFNDTNKENGNENRGNRKAFSSNNRDENSQAFRLKDSVNGTKSKCLVHIPEGKTSKSAKNLYQNENNEGRNISETKRSDAEDINTIGNKKESGNASIAEYKFANTVGTEKESHKTSDLKSGLCFEASENEYKYKGSGLNTIKEIRDEYSTIRSETASDTERKSEQKDEGFGCKFLEEDRMYTLAHKSSKLEVEKVEKYHSGTTHHSGTAHHSGTTHHSGTAHHSGTTHHSEDEMKEKTDNITCYGDVRKERIEHGAIKKSRKQYIPKRVRKYESSEEDSRSCCGSDIEGREASKSVDINEHKLNKSEKSRKQCKPRRIDQIQNINDQTLFMGNENEGAVIRESDKDSREDSNERYNFLETKYLNRWEKSSNDSWKKDNPSVLHDKKDESLEESGGSFNRTNESGETKVTSESSWQNFRNEDDEGSFVSLNSSPSLKSSSSLKSSPFYYGFSPTLDYISSLTPNLHRSSQSGNFALDENGQENLEVIRQLREIRCNRYRKISIAEKREIAGYASAHGVSQAAAYYNVSKSAVSMWTKLDFSTLEEDKSKQRKNCMIGNEKFEALCQKVKSEKESKFKGLTKQDKFEVSRYAKLVGVREMARCLNVALGTVSGWMRQFPYKVETESLDTQFSDDSNSKSSYFKNEFDDERKQLEDQGDSGMSHKRKISGENTKNNKKKKSNTDAVGKKLTEPGQNEDSTYILPADVGGTNDNIDDNNSKIFEISMERIASESDLDDSLQQKDELDKMIEETWQKPDFDKCYEEIKELIKDSPLEGDDFFRSLFERVISCRADKYKSLKPSEKLEVVRYAKRIGVRKVAKILGLATGTLSGWNTKYQSSLGITDPNIDMSNKSDLLVSYLTPDKNPDVVDSSTANQKFVTTPGASLDNCEKSEVTAIRLLFKEKFPVLVDKIALAKQMKFRNITTDEKIEFVKCSKLVGIRPTARVFNIPIGTLSGWIYKYSKTLHPAYHVDVDQDSPSSSQDGASQFAPMGIYNPNITGRTAAPTQLFHGLMSGSGAMSPEQGYSEGSGVNLFPHFSDLPSALSSSPSLLPASLSVSSSTRMVSSPLFLNKSVFENTEHSRDTNISKELETNENIHQVATSKSMNINQSENISETLNQSSIKTEPTDTKFVNDNFEKEAKLMAQQYLTAMYERMGIPTV